ncbi:MAG: spore germination protein GerW family protein [Chloroflexi bacterium]|nr:spore germination protein GerW family protein [Chloroflexota bacterium]
MLDRLSDKITERLRTDATVSTVFGEPLETQGKTVIPVARVRYGFGFGGGEGKDKDGDTGGGGGGGGGMSAKALGALIITETDERFVPFRTWRMMLAPTFFGFLLGLLVGRRLFR